MDKGMESSVLDNAIASLLRAKNTEPGINKFFLLTPHFFKLLCNSLFCCQFPSGNKQFLLIVVFAIAIRHIVFYFFSDTICKKSRQGIQIQLPSLIRYRGTRQFLQSAKLAIGQT